MSTNAVPVAKFRLGKIVQTSNALMHLYSYDILNAIQRHQAGDWGDVDAHDRAMNDQALVEGTRVLSVHRAEDGTKFWIITEGDRSVTTVLLPKDY